LVLAGSRPKTRIGYQAELAVLQDAKATNARQEFVASVAGLPSKVEEQRKVVLVKLEEEGDLARPLLWLAMARNLDGLLGPRLDEACERLMALGDTPDFSRGSGIDPATAVALGIVSHNTRPSLLVIFFRSFLQVLAKDSPTHARPAVPHARPAVPHGLHQHQRHRSTASLPHLPACFPPSALQVLATKASPTPVLLCHLASIFGKGTRRRVLEALGSRGARALVDALCPGQDPAALREELEAASNEESIMLSAITSEEILASCGEKLGLGNIDGFCAEIA